MKGDKGIGVEDRIDDISDSLGVLAAAHRPHPHQRHCGQVDSGLAVHVDAPQVVFNFVPLQDWNVGALLRAPLTPQLVLSVPLFDGEAPRGELLVRRFSGQRGARVLPLSGESENCTVVQFAAFSWVR